MNKRKGEFKLLISLMAMCAVFLVACGKKTDNQVNIGYFNNITHPQALYMKAEGILEDALGEEMQVEWTAFNAGPAEVEALFSGHIDIGYIGPFPAINANVKSDGDVMLLTGATKGGSVMVTRQGAGITSVEDLEVKNVAIPQIGNTQHLCLPALLQQYDLKPETSGGTVKVCAVSNADVENLMRRGDVDAALVPEPWGATLIENGASLMLDYDEIYLDGNFDVAVVVVRKDFMEEHPEVVEVFLEQHGVATEYINENKEEAITIINQEIKASTGKNLSESVLKEAFKRITVSTENNREAIAGFAQIARELKYIRRLPEDETMYVQ